MAQPQVSLFIDVQNRSFVRSFTSTIPALLPIAFQGDTLNLTLRFLQATGTPSAPYTDIDYSGAAVTVSVGANEAKPTAGLFTLTDTGSNQTTAALPYNATAAQVQTAVQTALTTNWPAATVYGGTGGPFYITNGSNGARGSLIGTSQTLEPASSVPITPLQVGGSTLPAIQLVQLSVNPIALQTSWTPSFSPDLLTGTLSLATASIEALMGSNPSLCTSFSIRVTPSGDSPFTAVQVPFLIQNDNILGAPSIPTPGATYYTAAESDARYSGSKISVTRNSTGAQAQHLVTSVSPASNQVLLISNNTSNPINLTFDNGTFDCQTATIGFAAANDTTPIHVAFVSANVAPAFVSGSDLSTATFYGDGVDVSFMWDVANSVWFPI